MVQPMPQVVTAPSTSARTAAAPGSYASRVPAWVLRGHRIMGVLQLLTGIFVIIISIVGLIIGSKHNSMSRGMFSSSYTYYSYQLRYSLVGGGVWSGLFFIAAGISGLSAGRPTGGCTLGCVVTCLVFSIIASTLAFSAMVTEAIAAAENRRTFKYSNPYVSYSHEDAYNAVYGTGIAVVLLCAFEFVLAIVHSTFACRASCCCVPSAVSTYQHQPQNQQVVMAGQQAHFTGQTGLYPEQQVFYYTTQPGHPPPPGYQVPQAGYPGPQADYAGPQTGYAVPQTGYAGPQAGYAGPQAGYAGPQAGYAGPQAGYAGSQAGSSAVPPSYESTVDGQTAKV